MTAAHDPDHAGPDSLADESELLVDALLGTRRGANDGDDRQPENGAGCGSCGCAAPVVCAACPVCRAASAIGSGSGSGGWSALAPTALASLADAAALLADGLHAAARALSPQHDAPPDDPTEPTTTTSPRSAGRGTDDEGTTR